MAAVFDAFLAIYKVRTADLYRIYTGGSGVLRPGAVISTSSIGSQTRRRRRRDMYCASAFAPWTTCRQSTSLLASTFVVS